MILPECRWMWEGIEGADSLVLNPHKWLGAAFDCSLYYVRDPEHLVRVMSTNPSYLQSAADDRVKNLRDWGIPLGRRFRALKLWCLIRAEGVGRRCRPACAATWPTPGGWRSRSAPPPGWRVLAPGAAADRLRPPRAAGPGRRGARRHTRAWAERVNRSGAAYLTPAILDGRWMVRVSIGAEADRARARRGALGADARSRGGELISPPGIPVAPLVPCQLLDFGVPYSPEYGKTRVLANAATQKSSGDNPLASFSRTLLGLQSWPRPRQSARPRPQRRVGYAELFEPGTSRHDRPRFFPRPSISTSSWRSRLIVPLRAPIQEQLHSLEDFYVAYHIHPGFQTETLRMAARTARSIVAPGSS